MSVFVCGLDTNASLAHLTAEAATGACLDGCTSFVSLMRSFIAASLAVFFHVLGFSIGCAIWAVIGWGLGSAFSHAPISGALTGIAWHLGCYIVQHDPMWASQRAHSRFLLVLDRAFA